MSYDAVKFLYTARKQQYHKKKKKGRTKNQRKHQPVGIEIFFIIFSRIIVGMILSKFLGITLIPIKPFPILPKLIIQFQVSFTPWLMLLSVTLVNQIIEIHNNISTGIAN